jgi:response regulator RpfG family c-di-GMP phosphodiesterase
LGWLGYPEGLKGEAIPLLARIFVVVDQWDALASDRPYRKAWTKEKIVAYFQENAGKIYDPQIVNVFLTII